LQSFTGSGNNPLRLLVVRDGKPLHVGQIRGGIYFASLPAGLPGDVRPVTDDASILRFERGRLRIEAGARGLG
jgi:hypothetical protein